MPIVNFKATTVWKAFMLNALASSVIIVLAIVIKSNLDKYTIEKNKIKRESTLASISYTFLFTFISTFLAYTLMFFIFGFGSSMLAQN